MLTQITLSAITPIVMRGGFSMFATLATSSLSMLTLVTLITLSTLHNPFTYSTGSADGSSL
jgi:hypothetical protein